MYSAGFGGEQYQYYTMKVVADGSEAVIRGRVTQLKQLGTADSIVVATCVSEIGDRAAMELWLEAVEASHPGW
jgi:hypothetical protein